MDLFLQLNLINHLNNHKEKEVGISTLAFDLHEDLLWAGTKSGHSVTETGIPAVHFAL